MNREDIQILRTAALELQAEGDNLVRVAGIIQRIKNWWKARSNPEFAKRQGDVEEVYRNVKGPLVNLIQQLQELEKAFQNQDPDTVARLVGEVPKTIAEVTTDMRQLSKEMRKADKLVPVTYQDEEGNELTGNNFRYTRPGYQNNPAVKEKLLELLDPEFREIPIDTKIGKPLSSFSWFSRYTPENISISNNVLGNIHRSLMKGFEERGVPKKIAETIVSGGFWSFVENLKSLIMSNDAVLDTVHFPKVQGSIQNRPANQMELNIQPLVPVNIPIDLGIGMDELPLEVGGIQLHDIGASRAKREDLSMVYARPIKLTSEAVDRLREEIRKLNELRQGTPAEAEEVDAVITDNEDEGEVREASGPITKLVKKALISERLPLTHAVVKIGGLSFHHKARFAKILSSALRQEIDAECSVRHAGNDVEVQASLYGTKMTALPAIYDISTYVADRFFKATKAGIYVDVEPGFSSFALMESDVLDDSFRKVAFDQWRV